MDTAHLAGIFAHVFLTTQASVDPGLTEGL